VGKLEDLRVHFAAENDEAGLTSLIDHVREVKSDLVGRDNDVAKEVVQWLTVWLQNPAIFRDWLSLRRTSVDFLKRFVP
jgi:hypothetical protein